MTDDPRDELISAAVRLFQANGYKNTTVDDIVKAVGKSKYAFYHFFSNKEEVLYLIHERLINDLLANAERVSDQPLPIETKLEHVVANIMDNMQNYRAYLSVFLAEVGALTGERREVVEAKRNQYFHIVEEMIDQAVVGGQFRSDLEPKMAALGFLGMCNWMYTWFNPEGRYSSHAIGKLFLHIFLQGVRAENAPSRAEPDDRTKGVVLPPNVNELGDGPFQIPFLAHNGVRVHETELGWRVAAPGRPESTNHMGVAHGGLTATLVDAAVGLAVHKHSPPGTYSVTMNINVHYLAPGVGPLEAEGRVIQMGRSTAVGEATVRDASGKMVAVGTAIFAIRTRRD